MNLQQRQPMQPLKTNPQQGPQGPSLIDSGMSPAGMPQPQQQQQQPPWIQTGIGQPQTMQPNMQTMQRSPVMPVQQGQPINMPPQPGMGQVPGPSQAKQGTLPQAALQNLLRSPSSQMQQQQVLNILQSTAIKVK